MTQVEHGKTGVQSPSLREKRASLWSGVEHENASPQFSAAPATAKRYTDMLITLGEQKSMPIERPESGVVAVLQMPAKPV